MSDQITYDNKVDLQVATNIANINKVTASDMNEIKSVVNTNAEEIGDTTSLTTTDKTNVVNAVNELNTPEKWVSVGTTAPTDGRKVWFCKSNNLFNNNAERKNAYIVNPGSTGQVVSYSYSSATYSFVNCCEVKQGKTYTISWKQSQTPASTNGRQGCIVDNDNIVQQYMATWNNSENYVTFTANANGFLILGTDIYATSIQIYEPDIEEGIYVDSEQWFFDNYSTNEQVIGKWIDGKPLYRKVVNLGALPNATSKQVAHNIANIGLVVTLRGMAIDYRFLPIPFSATSNAYAISIFADKTNITIMAGNDRSGATGFAIIEYTKTTD